MERRERWGIAAAVASSCCGGTAVVATRWAVGEIDPLALAGLRYALGALLLGGAVKVLRPSWITGRDGLALIGWALLFFALFPALFTLSLAWTTAARGALALSCLPVLTLLVAAALSRETATPGKLIGVLMTFAGVATALAGGLAAAPPGAWRGDLLMLLTALVGAVYNAGARPWLARCPSLPWTAQGMAVGAVVLITMAGIGGELAGTTAMPATAWAAVAWLGVVGGAGAFLLWSMALERTTPTRVAVAVTINPLVAMLLAAPLLGEALPTSLFIGMALVAGGIVVASR